MDHTQVDLIQLKHMNLNLTSQNIYGTLMCGLRIFAGPPYSILLPGNVISTTVDRVYINVQPHYELSIAQLVSAISEVWKNLSWRTVLPSHPYGKKILHGV